MAVKDSPHYEDAGNEVVTVIVKVNGNIDYIRSAVITGDKNGPVRRYKLDDGDVINHNRDLGYKKLAVKLIEK